jgi:hypothetical protein
MYRLYATWTTAANRATNARYSVAGQPNTIPPINQQLTPDDALYDGKTWESLGVFTINSPAVSVQLSNLANGVVVADGIIAVPVEALHLAGNPADASSSAATVDNAALQSAAREAIARWAAAGASAELVQALASTTIVVDDLPGALLGLASPNAIWIDRDAAGRGWFVDTTFRDDAEFATSRGEFAGLAPAGGDAFGQMDLLSVVGHELGHVLGLGDYHEDHLMGSHLEPGVRRYPTLQVDEAQRVTHTALASRSDQWSDSSIPALDAVFTLAGEEAGFTSNLINMRGGRERSPHQSLARVHEQRLARTARVEVHSQRRKTLLKLKSGKALQENAGPAPDHSERWREVEEILAQDQAAPRRDAADGARPPSQT